MILSVTTPLNFEAVKIRTVNNSTICLSRLTAILLLTMREKVTNHCVLSDGNVRRSKPVLRFIVIFSNSSL